MASPLPLPGGGLRDRQKREREHRILSAARKLFDRRGYAATSMEEVADRSGLAVGTIYNYFASKDDLLVAIMNREADQLMALGERILENPPTDAAEAISALADLFVHSITADERLLWREVIAAAVSHPATLGARLFKADTRLLALVAAMIDKLKARGEIAPGIDSYRAAGVEYSLFLMWGMAFVMSDEMDEQTMREEIHRGIRLAVHGLLRPAPDTNLEKENGQ